MRSWEYAPSDARRLLTDPLAGWSGPVIGRGATVALTAALTAAGGVPAPRLWPAAERVAVDHAHDDRPADHPRPKRHGTPHSHRLAIDGLHPRWPAAR